MGHLYLKLFHPLGVPAGFVWQRCHANVTLCERIKQLSDSSWNRSTGSSYKFSVIVVVMIVVIVTALSENLCSCRSSSCASCKSNSRSDTSEVVLLI